MTISEIECPRARSTMAPCVARSGSLALAGSQGQVCVGCGHSPHELLAELGNRYTPASEVSASMSSATAADELAGAVVAYLAGRH